MSKQRNRSVAYWTGSSEWFEGSQVQKPLVATLDQIQEDIDQLRDYGADDQADAAEHVLDRLAEELRDALNEPLTPQQAAELTGYTPDHLRRLLRDGTLPNAGTEGSPRIRRANLPRKPNQNSSSIPESGDGDSTSVRSAMQEAQAVVNSK